MLTVTQATWKCDVQNLHLPEKSMTRWVTSDLFLKTLCQLKGFLILLHLHNWNCKLDPHFPCVSQRVNCNFAAHLLLLQTYPKPCCWSQCIYELLCTIYDSLMVTASTPTCTKLKALGNVSSSASLSLRTFIVSAKAASSSAHVFIISSHSAAVFVAQPLKTLCQPKGFLSILHLHNWNCQLDPHFPCVSQRVHCKSGPAF